MEQYFAQLTNGIVNNVAVTTSEFMAENPERYPGEWVETFFETDGKTYAGIGFSYDPITQNFIEPPKPIPLEA
jgi:hypothetical protein